MRCYDQFSSGYKQFNRNSWFQLILGLVVPAYLRPQQDAAVPAHVASVGSGSTPIPIVSQTEEINPDGSFKFRYWKNYFLVKSIVDDINKK